MKRILLLASMQCAALAALTAPAVVAIALLIGRMVDNSAAPQTLALVDGAAAAAAAISVPIAGWLADRTVSRFGRRRPWLIGGAICGLAGSVAMSVAATPLTLALAWMATQAAYNAVFAAINGLVADGLADSERMRAGGIFAAASFFGALPGLAAAALFAANVRAMLVAVPALAAIVIITVALRVDDPPPRRAHATDHGGANRSGLIQKRREPGRNAVGAHLSAVRSMLGSPFARVLAMRFLLAAELAAGLAFALYMFQARWDFTDVNAVHAVAISSLVGAVGVVGGASTLALMRGSGSSPSRVLAASLGLLAIGMLGRGFAPSLLIFLGATLAGGIAIGLGLAANRATAFALLPSDRSGFGLGLLAATGSVAAVIAPIAASLLLAAGETMADTADAYAVMYLLLAVPPAAVLLIPLLAKGRTDASRESGSGQPQRPESRPRKVSDSS